jgi:hypothetical protein
MQWLVIDCCRFAERSDGLKIVSFKWESLYHLTQFNGRLFGAYSLELQFLEHGFRKEGYLIAGLELSLRDVHKRFDGDGFGIFFGVFVEDANHDAVERRTHFFGEFCFLGDLLTDGRVVFFVEVEVCVHEQFHDLQYLYVEVVVLSHETVALDSQVDVWQCLHVAQVEVAQFYPAIHKT